MTLENLPRTNQKHDVIQLAAISGRHEERLRDLGVRPESYLDIVSNLRRLRIPLGFDDLVADRFSPKDGYLTRFKPSRFTDGTHPVFYSSLDEDTSIEEMRHHQRREFESLTSGQIPQPRYFTVFSAKFDGQTINLFPMQSDHPELTSADESGYHFCQTLGREASEGGIDAFVTPSARRPEGTCVPIFTEKAIDHRITVRYIGRFSFDGTTVVFERH